MQIGAGVVETARAVLAGQTRVEDCCAQALQRAHDHADINALRCVEPALAWQQAERVSERVRRGDRPVLAGVPIVIKDNVAWQGLPTSAGLNTDGLHPASTSATILQRLQDAGAIVIGRANMDELAYGVTGANVHTGQIRNPWRTDLHPGGSSGGSAAAVSAGIVPAAIGTDTVGSVRIPASLCGVAGIRPTHGLCPEEGIAPLSPTLDCVGPLAQRSEDLALLLSVMAGDPSIAQLEGATTLPALKVLALDGKFPVDVHPAVSELFRLSIEQLAQLGMRIEHGSCAAFATAPRVAGPILGAEAAARWAPMLDQHPHRFGHEVAGYLRKGASMTRERYQRALEERRAAIAQIDELFERFDLIVLPSTATTATPWKDPGPQLAFLGLTAAFSLSGHPACSVPMGQVDGLPVGLQIAARRGQDRLLLQVASAFEAAQSSV